MQHSASAQASPPSLTSWALAERTGANRLAHALERRGLRGQV